MTFDLLVNKLKCELFSFMTSSEYIPDNTSLLYICVCALPAYCDSCAARAQALVHGAARPPGPRWPHTIGAQTVKKFTLLLFLCIDIIYRFGLARHPIFIWTLYKYVRRMLEIAARLCHNSTPFDATLAWRLHQVATHSSPILHTASLFLLRTAPFYAHGPCFALSEGLPINRSRE